MSFEFTCPHCGKTLEAETEWIGSKGKCPSCNKEIMITLPQNDINDDIVEMKPASQQKEYNINSSSNSVEVENNQHEKVSTNDFNEQYEQLLQKQNIGTKNKNKIKYISIFVLVALSIIALIFYISKKYIPKNYCTKAELDIITDIQKATGLSIGEVINADQDIISHIKNAQFLFDNYPYERQLYRVKNYKPNSFMNFKYCVVEIIPSSGIICGFEFINYYSCFYSFQRKLNNEENDIIDAVKLKYQIELDHIGDSDFSASRFFGKKYRAIVSYRTTNNIGSYHTSNGERRLGEMVFERLSYHVSDMELDKIKDKELEIMKNEKRIEELKSKGVINKQIK